MSDIYVGLKAQNIDIGAEMPDITGIRLLVDSDHEYVVGDAAGRMIEVECPWGTEDMAKNILATMSGVQYRPYTAERAMLDPAFEPGDAVIVGGVSSVIANSDINYNGAALANIDAPALDEIDDEYPAQQIKASSFERQLAYTRSLITKSASEIKLGVADEIKRVEGLIDVQADNLSLSVDNGDTSSTIKLMLTKTKEDGTTSQIALSSQSISFNGVVTFDALAGEPTGTTTINGGWIDADTLTVEAANITGRLGAGKIDLYGNMTVFTDSDLDTKGGKIGYKPSNVDGGAGMQMSAPDESSGVAATYNGARVWFANEVDGDEIVELNQIWVSSDSAGISVANKNYLQVYGHTEIVKLRGKKWDFSEVDEVVGVTAGSTTAVFK